jgi:hypothetical protein
MPAPTDHARALHGLVEPLHSTLYFAPDVKEEYETLGLEPLAQGYVAGRAAPFGAVGPGVVTATFFNFNPDLIRLGVPSAWEITTPVEVLAARARGIERLFTRIDAPTDGLAEATELARTAAAAADLAGRPLAAANADVIPAGSPFADLWQALAVLREHRGDGHVALLVSAELSPVEALVLYAGWQGTVSRRFLQSTRLWDDDAWEAAETSLRDRGLVADDGSLTDDGTELREDLEGFTDELASGPYAALGDDGCLRLFDLLRPLAETLDGAGVYKRGLRLPDRPAA